MAKLFITVLSALLCVAFASAYKNSWKSRASTLEFEHVARREVRGGTPSAQCLQTVDVFGDLYNVTERDEAKNALANSLKKICKLTENPEECERMVDQHSDELAEILAGALEPSFVSTYLHQCKSMFFPIPKCLICKGVADTIKKYLASGKNEQQIVDALRKFCKSVPIGKEFCVSLVDKYVVKLIQYVKNHTAKEACQKIYIC